MISELCIAGASHRGVAYVGAMKYLEEIGVLRRQDLKKLIGVSIGSFIGTCFILGFELDVFLDYLLKTEFGPFQDISLTGNDLSLLQGLSFRKWVRDTLSLKIDPDILLSEFKEKTGVHLIVSAVSIDEDKVIYLGLERDMRLCDALICSMNFPFAFPPYTVDGITYIDGGLVDNFPMQLLGPSAVGLMATRKKSNKLSFFNYPVKLYDILKSKLESLVKYESINIIKLDLSDASLLEFSLNEDDKLTLYAEGYLACKNARIVRELYLEKKSRDALVEVHKDIKSVSFDSFDSDIKSV